MYLIINEANYNYYLNKKNVINLNDKINIVLYLKSKFINIKTLKKYFKNIDKIFLIINNYILNRYFNNIEMFEYYFNKEIIILLI